MKSQKTIRTTRPAMCSALKDAARLSDATLFGRSRPMSSMSTPAIKKPSQSAVAFTSISHFAELQEFQNRKGAREQPRQAKEKSLPVQFEQLINGRAQGWNVGRSTTEE